MSGVLQFGLMVRTLDYSMEVPGSNPTRVLFFSTSYIIEDNVFENSKSQCYRILMHMYSVYYTAGRSRIASKLAVRLPDE